MAGLVPAIHVLRTGTAIKTWMPATSAGMTIAVASRALLPEQLHRFVGQDAAGDLDRIPFCPHRHLSACDLDLIHQAADLANLAVNSWNLQVIPIIY